MSLVDHALFEPVFAPLAGKSVGFVTLDGNVGDRLIDQAAESLMQEFSVSYRPLAWPELRTGVLLRPVDAVVVSGGGNMGARYPVTVHQRGKALALGAPVTVLPQSFTDADESIDAYARVYVRERASLAMKPGTVLAPDLALGHRPPWVDEGASAATGVWLRGDGERHVGGCDVSLGDPVEVSATTEDYLGLASRFEHVVTDRLHFAIAALLVGRRATLLPNGYHKNRAMYETWLRDLGCRWRSRADGFRTPVAVEEDELWKRLAAPPSALVPWNARPRTRDDWSVSSTDTATQLAGPDGEIVALDPVSSMLWQLCDGQWSVEDLCGALAERYDQSVLRIARDVQGALRNLRGRGALQGDGVTDVDDQPVPPDSAPMVLRRASLRVAIEAPRRRRGRLHWAASVGDGAGGRFRHEFDLPLAMRDALTRRADPFLLALLPRAMFDGIDIQVHGAAVDALLLDRLDEYQQLLATWWPSWFQVVGIEAEEVRARPLAEPRAIAACSGGLDSVYTLCRHRVVDDGRRNARLDAVLMAGGYDIPINDRAGYAGALDRVRPLAEEAGVALVDVASNLRSHLPAWEKTHGAALAAVLHLVAGGFDRGLVPSTAPYRMLFPWGSSPIGDHLLGGAFSIVHDGAAVLRLDKLRAVAPWPRAVEALRVCWVNHHGDRNCGRCLKCCHLAVMLRALGLSEACFAQPPEDRHLVRFVEQAHLKGLERIDLSCTLAAARASGLQQQWVEVLADRLADGHAFVDSKIPQQGMAPEVECE